VGVELRVLRTAGVMAEAGYNKIAGLVPFNLAVFPDPGSGGVALGEGQRHLHRAVMRPDQAARFDRAVSKALTEGNGE
jgi:hypothetical protein